MSSYHTIHANVHAKTAHLKVQHCTSRDSTSLAWLTPGFELFCIAGPHASRNALAQSANKIVQWVRREEERIFIIGGAVSLPSLVLAIDAGLVLMRWHRSSSAVVSAARSNMEGDCRTRSYGERLSLVPYVNAEAGDVKPYYPNVQTLVLGGACDG